MLEKWGKKKGDVYIRRRRMRAKNRRQRKGLSILESKHDVSLIFGTSEGEDILDVDDVEEVVQPVDEDIIEEQMFTFDKFEAVV